ncbi:diacylglycerol/lipid kinase family protein [Enterococcus canis]|nr:diacylglycerol kinase family protein [Enterococcus canis]
MECLLIINPSSGGEEAQEYREKIENRLRSLFDTVQIRETEGAGDAKKFAAEAAAAKVDSVFAMGGDGTVNEAISGLAEKEFRPKFGFFPLGTVNDLARALDIPLDPNEAIEQLTLRTKKIDIGKINDHYFINVVALGTIPAAVNETATSEKTKLGKLAYFVNGAKGVLNNDYYQFELLLDDKKQQITSSTLLVGLTNSIGGFEGLLPEAEVDDGLLHLIYLKDESLFDTLKAAPGLVKGVTEENQNLGYIAFKAGTITADQSLTANVDGDPGDELPLQLAVLPQHLSVYY